MKKVTRRSFFKSAGMAAAAVPVIGSIRAEAQQQPAAAAAADPAAAAAAGNVERDVVYGKGGDMELHLDIYRPPAGVTPRKMAVIHLHGGGFTQGSKTGVQASSRAFAGLGYVSIAAQYRLSGQAKWPAQIEDTKAAIRWTRANAAKLGIDADKIAIAGYSAGGLMAFVAAGTNDGTKYEGNGGNAGVSSKVSACIGFYPATFANASLFPDGTDRATIDAAGAVNLISPNFAPTIFLHGLGDTTIPANNSIDFFQKLRAANVKVDLHLIQGAAHAFETSSPDAALLSAQAANLFLDRLIINPKEYPAFGGGGRGAGGGRGGAGGGGGAAGGAPRGGQRQ